MPAEKCEDLIDRHCLHCPLPACHPIKSKQALQAGLIYHSADLPKGLLIEPDSGLRRQIRSHAAVTKKHIPEIVRKSGRCHLPPYCCRVGHDAVDAGRTLQLLCKSFFTGCNYVLTCFLLGLLDVHFAACLLRHVLGHLLCDLFVLADQMCRSAKLVSLCMPKEIEQQKVFFALAKPCTSADHLTV
jgi:hypothetical protein